MTIAILADVHANLEAFEACIADAALMGATRHALLGDLVGYGADPKSVLRLAWDWLGRDGIVVRGNHDAAAAGDDAVLGEMTADAAAAIRWTRSRLDRDEVRHLRELPLTTRDNGVLYVHADARRPSAWAYVLTADDADRTMGAIPDRIVMSGHVHSTTLWRLSPARGAVPIALLHEDAVPLMDSASWLAVVGSVGQPRDGDPRATYALFDPVTATLTLRRVAYDTETAARKIRGAGLPPRLADRLLRGR